MPKKKLKKNESKQFSFKEIAALLFLLFLPTQFGKHFFLTFSFINGVRVDYLAPTIYLTDLLFIVLLFFNYPLIVNSFKNKKLQLVFGLLLIPLFFAESKGIALYRYLKIFELASVFLIFRNISLPVKKLVNVFLTSSVVIIIIATIQFITKSSVQGLFYFLGERYLSLSTPGIAKASLQGVEFLRPYATFSHPNSMAGFYLLTYLFFLTRKENSLLKNILIFISAFLVLISFSKVAILALIIFTLLYFSTIWKTIECKFCIASRIGILVVLGFIFALAKNDPASLDNRIIFLNNAYSLILAHPLLGVGPGNYIIAQSNLAKELFVLTQPVHNIFVLFVTEVGLIIGGYILYLLFKYFQKSLKSLDFFLIFLAVIFTGLFDHYWLTLQQNLLLMGVIFGLILNYSNSSRRTR